jgi:hypothetical protein
MFIGIGALIFAKHPALYSLAEVTIIGMFSVVLMAYLFPPLIFRWLVYSHGKERLRPLTIKNLVCRNNAQIVDWVSDSYRYRGIEIMTAVNKRLRRYKNKGYFGLIDEQLSSSTKTVIFVNSGWGEVLMYYALKIPNMNFVSIEKEPDKICVARNVAENRVSNVSFFEDYNVYTHQLGGENEEVLVFLLDPSENDIKKYSFLDPVIINKVGINKNHRHEK